MRVRAAHAQRVDAGAPWAFVRDPRAQRVVDLKWAGVEVDRGIGLFVAQTRGNFPVLERQRHLDQAGHAGGGVGVADVGFDRADATEAGLGRGGLKRLRERGHFDRITQVGAGAVAFHIVNGVGAHASHRLSLGDGLGLPVHTGRQVSGLGRAVVVDRGALDHGPDVVTVLDGVFKPAQRHHPGARAEHGALGPVVESVAMAIGREDLTLLEDVAAPVRQLDRDTPGQGHVAFTEQQGLAGVMHRHQGGRASRLDVDARTLEVKDVAGPGGQKIFVVAGVAQQEHASAGHQIWVRADIEIEVTPHAATGVHANRPGEGLGRMPSALERLPGHLQELAVLRVHDGGFLGTEAKEVGVELLESLQHGRHRYVVAVAHPQGAFACCQQLSFCQPADGLDTLAQVGPISHRIGSTWQVRRHADDGDVIGFG